MIERHEPVLRKLTALPTASGLAARLALAQLERQGIDPTPLLARCGLTAAALVSRERVSVSSQIQFLELAARATRDDWLGLTIAANFDLREWGILYYAAASSHQLDDALKRLERCADGGTAKRFWPKGCDAVVFRLGEAAAGEPTKVTLNGVIQQDDGKKFGAMAAALDKAVVVLDSGAGSVGAAIEIGRAIQLKGLATAVPEQRLCASTCALMKRPGGVLFGCDR